MTDQTIPDDVTPEDMEHARSYVQDFLDAMYVPDRTRAVARVLQAFLPPPPLPPRPTLADMTVKERAACQRMQADVKGRLDRWAITRPFGEGGDVETVSESGQISWFPPGHVTPRPDLPRLEWPGTGQGADDVPPVKVGDVIESADDARISALPVGTVLRDLGGEEVKRMGESADTWDGVGYIPIAGDGTEYGPWTVARLPKKPDTDDTVPESTLAVGSVWADADALTRACEETGRDQITATDRDGDVYVWDANLHDWRDLHPIPNYAPFTIIHDGKKAHQ